MATPTVAPYGSWHSPITSELIVSRALGIGEVAFDGKDTYWLESRPLAGGRNVLVRRTADGTIADVTPPPFNVRTTVHEYGGGAFAVADGTVYFANFADQRLYRQAPGEAPAPLTPEALLRYADGVVDARRGRSIWVRESHSVPGEAKNSIVSVSLADGDTGTVLVAGHDFYASPRLSPDGSRLAWLAWNHPNMPWDGCELWVADVTDDGNLAHAARIAGGEGESIFQPEWSPDSLLHFVSDRTGWWNLYRWRDGQAEPLTPMEAEFGLPQWVFGMSTYAFAATDKIVCTYLAAGRGNLGLLDTRNGKLMPVQSPYTDFDDNVRAAPGFAVFSAGSPTEPLALVRFDLATGDLTVLRRSTDLAVDPGYIAAAQAVAFPTTDGRTAYGFYYPPQNRDFAAPSGEKPPLIVKSHGGPTAATGTALRLNTQFWTSRGFAVLDVNYGGSTGYGRAYRERLDGQWGIVDVDDCVNGAKYLAEQGLVDSERLAITGGSAGGYTTLAALTFRDIFRAGSSHYGVSDLEALARDTHKFESRYLDRLVGPYPARRDIYVERSPINFVDRLATPTIFFQGLEDKVVPPDQAERMVGALRAKGVPVAYLPFPGEQHGFRKADNIKRALDAELYFYGRIFGFTPADAVDPVKIENL
ncbi:MAG: dipeptidyl-peptidase 5 [Chloroflexota bacterium]